MARHAAMKTERLTILLAPKDKSDIEHRARIHSMSTGEFVRRATRLYDPSPEAVALQALAREIQGHARAMRKTLSATRALVEKRLKEIAALKAARP